MATSNTVFKDCIINLISALQYEFGSEVTSFYFGDVIVYPPSAFISPTGKYCPVIAVSPSYNHLNEGSQAANGEIRSLGIDILLLVNYTPFIEAIPTQAAGEEILIDITDRVFEYLRRFDMLTIYETVLMANVSDVNWTWSPRQNQPIRGAVISYELQVAIDYN